MNKINIIISSLIVLLYSITHCYFSLPKEELLVKEEKDNSIISYSFSNNLLQVNIIKDKIYYLDSTNTLYVIDLKTKLQERIDNVSQAYYCTLKNHLTCISPEKTVIYDLNLKNLFNSSPNDVIPYKDTFLILKNNNFLLIQNKEEKIFQSLEKLTSDFLYQDYYQTESNTFVLFSDNQSFLLYDINNKDFKEIKSTNFHSYENGFYFYNTENIEIINLKDNKSQTYPNIYKEDLSVSCIKNDNELYFLKNNILTIHNLETNVTKELQFPDANSLTIQKQHLLATTKNNLYLLNLNELPTSLDLITDSASDIDISKVDQLTSIENKFPIHIYTKEQTNISFPDFSLEIENDDSIINEALTKIEPILNKFDSNFYQSLINDKFTGLNIYLTSTLSPKDQINQISNPAAYTLTLDGKFHIVIDISQDNLDEIMCHELMHTLELNLKYTGSNPFSDWNKYNPPNFTYYNSYTKERSNNYTLKEEDENNIYFIDTYSHTYPEEDRARIFENICTTTSIDLTKYPHLYSKAIYIQEEILKNYPSLNNTTLFQNFNSS